MAIAIFFGIAYFGTGSLLAALILTVAASPFFK